MIIKNFLKTAVLGIAFCSVFCMSSSIAMDNNSQLNKDNLIEIYRQQLRDIFYEVYSYDSEGRDFKVDTMAKKSLGYNMNINPETDDKIKSTLLRIKYIINKALYKRLDSTDYSNVRKYISIVQANINTKYYNKNYEHDCQIISKNSDNIINAVSQIYFKLPSSALSSSALLYYDPEDNDFYKTDNPTVLQSISNELHHDLNKQICMQKQTPFPRIRESQGILSHIVYKVMEIIDNVITNNNIDTETYEQAKLYINDLKKNELRAKEYVSRWTIASLTILRKSDTILDELKKYLHVDKINNK